jgi:hypothetical protein
MGDLLVFDRGIAVMRANIELQCYISLILNSKSGAELARFRLEALNCVDRLYLAKCRMDFRALPFDDDDYPV